jgi:hypothetical protein
VRQPIIYEKHIRGHQAARSKAPTSVSSGRTGDFCADFNNIAHFDEKNIKILAQYLRKLSVLIYLMASTINA